MITQSGCFSHTKYDPIDSVEEAGAAVEEIIETDTLVPTATDEDAEANVIGAAQLLGEYLRRVRILTWAVVAITLYLVLKEVKE